MTTLAWPGVFIAIIAIGVGLVMLVAPIRIYRLLYMWLRWVLGEAMPPHQRRDMLLLFDGPAEWARQHRGAVILCRVYGAVAVMGSLLAVGILILASTGPRSR